ncbi:nicotinate-nucleotide adenylyltransferase [Maridesulfovibrio sp. FT414]|uniref:nicotinate-nucleotide adenylyltransferase n=1 Tax=Maridesulfovibrio sp. FT414 TaxID=2979469 RepID=UPI003D80933A
MKIGLFGGSFNPVHSTHIDVARSVMERLGLDKVLLIPAGNPYHKEQEEMLPEELRFELVRLAVAGEAGLEVSDIDLGAEGPTFTIDTLTEAVKRYPDDELYFIMGQDSFESFSLWKDWEKIPKLANLVAVSREEADHGSMVHELQRIFTDIEQAGVNVWKIKDAKSVYIIGDFDFVISSTLVRDVWKQGGTVEDYVPEQVAHFMVANRGLFESYWH